MPVCPARKPSVASSVAEANRSAQGHRAAARPENVEKTCGSARQRSPTAGGTVTNALLADASFQRWATDFPLTLPVARQRTRAQFDLCAGFVYSQVLFACVRLGVFPLLAEGPAHLDDLARSIDLTPDATHRLVDAAASLKLLSRRDGDRVALGALWSRARRQPRRRRD